MSQIAQARASSVHYIRTWLEVAGYFLSGTACGLLRGCCKGIRTTDTRVERL